MIDEIFDRQYQSGRKALHDGVDSLVRRIADAIAATFETMQRVQFDAPWAKNNRSGVA